ncbi:DUF4192 domain-containing protein [Nocardioides sp. GXQ0305]|uniref:DUF4192 domain-containing protein n=1 Tax=Nocardioides sp. GXQ0305 TaxID=3423912 RepID=UPI003D7CD434
MTTLTARSPEDLLAVVPFVLGFEPADSIVMLTVDAPQTFHARVDLPSDRQGVAEVVDLLLEPAVRHRARTAVLVLYTPDDDLARVAVRRFRRGRDGGRGPDLVEALRVDAGRWFPLLRGRAGPGTSGVPFDVSHHPFVAEAVLAGRVLHGSRADLAATLRPDAAAVAEVAAAPGEPAPGAWVAATLAEWVGRADPPPADVAARLLRSLVDPSARDSAWAGVPRSGARDHVRFWEAMVRRAPDDLVAHAAAVLALCAWVAGDGALGWCAVDRAREADAAHTLAALVADLLTAAVPPVEWEVMRHRLASAC